MTSLEKKKEYQKTYLKKHPWAKSYRSTYANAYQKDLEHTMKVADFKGLWFRDRAFEMSQPSVDRVDTSKGYVKQNCRYLELKENKAREARGRVCVLRKLSDEQLVKVRSLLSNGVPQRTIAKQFNVSQLVISRIHLNKTYVTTN